MNMNNILNQLDLDTALRNLSIVESIGAADPDLTWDFRKTANNLSIVFPLVDGQTPTGDMRQRMDAIISRVTDVLKDRATFEALTATFEAHWRLY